MSLEFIILLMFILFFQSLEYLISAYKFGSFHKIQEFMRFRERVRDSHTFALVVLENMMLDLLLESENHASTAQVLYDCLFVFVKFIHLCV